MPSDHPDVPVDSVSEIPWDKIKAEVRMRESVVSEIADKLKAASVSASMEIAATDVFVEKAERSLIARAEKMRRLSRYCLVFVGGMTLTSLGALFAPIGLFTSDPTTTQSTILSALHNFAALGILLGLIYLGASLLRAFLHESTVLENRVHSLRLGRLYVYLKLSSVHDDKELNRIRSKMGAQDIERIFGWNIESSTAFKDIRPEYMSRNLMAQVVEAVGKLARRKSG